MEIGYNISIWFNPVAGEWEGQLLNSKGDILAEASGGEDPQAVGELLAELINEEHEYDLEVNELEDGLDSLFDSKKKIDDIFSDDPNSKFPNNLEDN